MGMRALAISAIILVAVIMAISAIAPATAQFVNPVLAFSDGCADLRGGFVCVAADADRDGECDSKSFGMRIQAANAAGVNGFCNAPGPI